MRKEEASANIVVNVKIWTSKLFSIWGRKRKGF